ncbi:hypothetical protein [Methylocella sp.]|uniref:hypothetical protein n=1 Tax=Methylocella sp. TaxID=1978226 RepID=UPI003784DA5A
MTARSDAGALRQTARRLSARFGHEAGLVLAARVLQNLNGLLLSAIIVRSFGLPAAGTLTIATAAVAVIALVGAFGLPYVFARMDAPMPVRNALGCAAALVVVPASLPFLAVLGALAGRSHEEALVIFLLALGGPFFAQGNLLNALQVLQGKAGEAVIAPAANSLGLLFAALFGSSYAGFAAILAAFRFAGVAVAFLRLKRAPLDFRLFVRQAREGSRFLVGDSMNLGVDQASVLIASYLMSRADLGLFGLARQMLTVAETPGWSQMQAKYPAVVGDPDGALPPLRRLMLKLGAACAAGVALLAVPLGLFVFNLPRFTLLAPLLLASTPIRYLLSTYDLHLRAIGALDAVNRVSAIRGALGLVVIPLGAAFAGALGAILGVILHVALATALTARASAAFGPRAAPRMSEAGAPS